MEAFIYWAITCWSRKNSGRSSISYRQYKPLREKIGEDSDIEERHNATKSELENLGGSNSQIDSKKVLRSPEAEDSSSSDEELSVAPADRGI